MVNMAHNGNHRRTQFQGLRVILDFGDFRRVCIWRQFFTSYTELGGYESSRIIVDFLVDGSHYAHHKEFLHHFSGGVAHLGGQVLNGNHFRQFDVFRTGDFHLRCRLLAAALVVTALAATAVITAAIAFITVVAVVSVIAAAPVVLAATTLISVIALITVVALVFVAVIAAATLYSVAVAVAAFNTLAAVISVIAALAACRTVIMTFALGRTLALAVTIMMILFPSRFLRSCVLYLYLLLSFRLDFFGRSLGCRFRIFIIMLHQGLTFCLPNAAKIILYSEISLTQYF